MMPKLTIPKTPKMEVLRSALGKADLEWAVFKNHDERMVTINVWIGEEDE
tara:strand:- start:996 stop:1145 length:150 start_codon:yes stop_codon:yes gene_type:complete